MTTIAPATPYSAPTAANTAQPPAEAGFWKRASDNIGEFFSDVADSLHFGETYKLIRREFQQLDQNSNGTVSNGEFIVGTLTLNPMEFRSADKNLDNHLSLNEYVDYRKTKLSHAFAQKDVNSDHFLNTVEIGTVGRLYLANRDPAVDANQDGLLSQREYMRAHLRLGISIRDMFGF